MAEQFEYQGYTVKIEITREGEPGEGMWFAEYDIYQTGGRRVDGAALGLPYPSAEEARRNVTDFAKGAIDKLPR